MQIVVDLSPVVHKKAGLGRYARLLTEHLVTQDKTNAYVAFAHGKFSDELLPPALRALPRATLPLDARPWRMLVWLAHVLRVPMDRVLPRADIFHATEHLLPPLKNARTVFTLHDLIFQFFPEYHLPLNRWFLRNAMPYFLRRADAIIAVSECTKRDAIRFYNLPPEKITVIYEAADPALATRKRSESHRRRARAVCQESAVSLFRQRDRAAQKYRRASGCTARVARAWLSASFADCGAQGLAVPSHIRSRQANGNGKSG